MGNATRGGRRRGAAFTLVEILVVIVILMLLMGILAPAATTALTRINRSISQSYIYAIQGGLESYHNDFGAYPPSSVDDWHGSELVVLYLTGYADDDGDGEPTDMTSDDGRDGWGFRTTKRGRVYGPYNGLEKLPMTTEGGRREFIDKFDQRILYYRFEGGYTDSDNEDGPANLNTDYAQYETDKYYRSDFILISPGPNTQWDNDPESRSADDVTNWK
jgi:type II secretory pathway pseudopilin PulG